MSLPNLLLQFLGWAVLLSAIYMLIDRLGVLSEARSFQRGDDDAPLARERDNGRRGVWAGTEPPNLNRARAAGVDGDDARPLTKIHRIRPK